MFKEIGTYIGYSVGGLGGAIIGGSIGGLIDESDN